MNFIILDLKHLLFKLIWKIKISNEEEVNEKLDDIAETMVQEILHDVLKDVIQDNSTSSHNNLNDFDETINDDVNIALHEANVKGFTHHHKVYFRFICFKY